MSDLQPLIESSENARARQLLQAAKSDRPGRTSAQRTLVALGVVSASTTIASTAVAAAGAAKAGVGLGGVGSSALPAIALKWLVIGSVGGAALASGAAYLTSGSSPSAQSVQVAARAVPAAVQVAPVVPAGPLPPLGEPAAALPTALHPQPTEPWRSPAPVVESAPAILPAQAPETAPSQASFAAPDHSKVLRDVALLDQARSVLRGGDTARALAALDHYDQARETHILDREAQLLRIEALVQHGDSGRAAELARAYLASYPNDAHAMRLKTLAGLPTEGK